MDNYRPSKRLEHFLSTYLEFDEKQLHLGIWGGDFKGQDVSLRNDSFFPILNMWKETDESNPETRSNPISFLTKEMLLNSDGVGVEARLSTKTTSPLSALNLILERGTIGRFRAQIPWTSLMIGGKLDDVRLEMQDVVIRLGVESCIAKGFENRNGSEQGRKGGFEDLYGAQRDADGNISFSGPTSDGINDLEYISGGIGINRVQKQKLIERALKCLENEQDIPYSADGDTDSPNHNQSENENKNKTNDDTKDSKKVFLQHFVRSFASKVGWRLGQGLYVKIKNFQVIMGQDGVDVGFFMKSFEIVDNNVDNTKNENENADDNSNSNSTQSSKRRRTKYSKQSNVCHEDNESSNAKKSSNPEQRQTIEKKVKITGCGFFIRKPSNSQNQIERMEPLLEEFVTNPADITTSIHLHRTKPTQDKINISQSGFNMKVPEKVESSQLVHNDKKFALVPDDLSEITEDTGRSRRGKREKVHGNNKENALQLSENKPTDISNNPTASETFEPQVSVNTAIEAIQVVLSAQKMSLMSSFLKRLFQLKNGRPTSPMIPTFNADTAPSLRQEHENSQLIRSWWRYAIFNVIREVRKRRLLAYEFSGFDLAKQHRWRKEYIYLFIKIVLSDKAQYSKNIDVSFLEGITDEEKLLKLEDSLYVEEILLYRSIAESISRENSKAWQRRVFGINSSEATSSEFPAGFLNNRNNNTNFPRQLLSLKEEEEEEITIAERRHRFAMSLPSPTVSQEDDLLVPKSDTKALQQKRSGPRYQRRKTLHFQSKSSLFESFAHRPQRSRLPSIFEPLRNSNDNMTEGSVRSVSTVPKNLESSLEQFDNTVRRDPRSIFFDRNLIDDSGTLVDEDWNVTSSTNFTLHSFSVYLLSDKDGHDCTDEDEISILTTSTMEGASQFSVRGLHEVVLSLDLFDISVVFDEGINNKKVSFSVDAIICQVANNHLMTCGRVKRILNRPKKGNYFDLVKNHQLNGLNLLGNPPNFDAKKSSWDPFIQGEVLFSKQKLEGNNSRKLISTTLTVSQIFCTIDWCSITELAEFIHDNTELELVVDKHDIISWSKLDHHRINLINRLHVIHQHISEYFFRRVLRCQGIDVMIPIGEGARVSKPERMLALSVHSLSVQHGFNVYADVTLKDSILADKIVENREEHLEKILEEFTPSQFSHKIISFSSVELKLITKKDTLKHSDSIEWIIPAFDGEVIVSTSLERLDLTKPFFYASAITSPLNIVLTNRLIQIIPKLLNMLKPMQLTPPENVSKGADRTDASLIEPRLADFAPHILARLALSVPSLRISIQSENQTLEEIGPDTGNFFGIVMEETLSDFLSHISCFDLNHPPKEVVLASTEIAIGRLCALDISREDAKDYIQTAHQIFVEESNLAKLTAAARVEDGRKDITLEKGRIYKTHRSNSNGKFSNHPKPTDVTPKTPVQIMTNIIENAVSRTTLLMTQEAKLRPRSLPIKEAFILELPSGFSVMCDRMSYDYHLHGQIEALLVRNSSGANFLEVFSSEATSFEEDSSDAEEMEDASRMGIVLDWTLKECDTNFGGGGKHLSVVSSDRLLSEACANRKCHTETELSLGSLNCLFSANDASNAVKAFSPLTASFGSSTTEKNTENQKHNSNATPLIQKSTAGKITSCSILFCSDELQPFTRLLMDDMAFEAESSRELLDQKISMLITAASRKIRLLDLTPQGQLYHEILIPDVSAQLDEDSEDQEVSRPFNMALTLTDDPWHFPSELLVEFSNLQILILRRFLNEFLQYFLYTDYGFGKFSAESNEENLHESKKQDRIQHPMNYQLSILNSCLILPVNSLSGDLIAIESDYIVITNSYHDKSWSFPNASVEVKPNSAASQGSDSAVMDPITGGQASNEDLSEDHKDPSFFECLENDLRYDSKSSIDFHTNESEHENNDKDLDIKGFDSSLLFRANISSENMRIYTAISTENSSRDHTSLEDIPFLFSFLKLRKVVDDNLVFGSSYPIPEKLQSQKTTLLSDLCRRKWEQITPQSVQMEVLADFLPTHMRLLVKDHITNTDDVDIVSSPFTLDLRASQLYVIISTWYSNMQELPLMFPYKEDVFKMAEKPACPENWPEYGSDEFKRRLHMEMEKTFEMAVYFKSLNWRCTIDRPDYFPRKFECTFMIDPLKESVDFHAKDFGIQVDFDQENVMRVGSGATAFSILDHRSGRSVHTKALDIGGSNANCPTNFMDMTWGLENDRESLFEKLALPLRLSVFMTPDNWCLANIGFQDANFCASDLSCIWILLEYFSSYFQYKEFGHPWFAVSEQKELFKQSETYNKDAGAYDSTGNTDDGSKKMDFRLSLLRPHFIIPSDPLSQSQPCLILTSENNGLFYQYQTVGLDFISQEVCSKNLDVAVAKKFSHSIGRDFRMLSSSDIDFKFIVHGLNFGLKYDVHPKMKYKNVSLSMPLPENSVEKGIQVRPLLLPAPVICKPWLPMDRKMDDLGCDVILSPEDLRFAADVLGNFAGPYQEPNLSELEPSIESDGKSVESEDPFSVSVKAKDVRLFISNPALGVQMPVAAICIEKMKVSVSKLLGIGETNSRANSKDFQASLEVKLCVDYFKNAPTRSWEPLLEPHKCIVFFEKSARRGQGITYTSENPVHVNISGSLLETLYFTLGNVSDSIFKVLQKKSSSTLNNEEDILRDQGFVKNTIFHYSPTDTFTRFDTTNMFAQNEVFHKKSLPLSSNDRVPFSLFNLTGETLRFHQKSEESHMSIHYLYDHEAKALSFPATMSKLRNLKVVEVPFDGLGHEKSKASHVNQIDSTHNIDIQIPGFMWTREVCVDKPGKSFLDIKPKSDVVQKKLREDWRLENALKILSDVAFFDGGRQVSLASPFEIVNKTCHQIELAIHPDPMYANRGNSRKKNKSASTGFDCQFQKINSDETFRIPIMLMVAALSSVKGDHLGSFWLRPEEGEGEALLSDCFRAQNDKSSCGATVGFCSRPIEIAELVHETDSKFRKSRGAMLTTKEARSSYQLSGPIVKDKEENVSPFCYCIEVRRSPVVKPFPGHGENIANERVATNELDRPSTSNDTATNSGQLYSDSKDLSSQNDADEIVNVKKQDHVEPTIHGPVAYSLLIHAPIIVENLLPEIARFELMHAAKRQVVWFRDLQPGESIAIHTVGLDAALLLLLNIGYCRTPLGEGALVHHGSERQNTAAFTHRASRDDGVEKSDSMTTSEEDLGQETLAQISSPSKIETNRVNNTTISPEHDHAVASETTNESADESPKRKKSQTVYNMNDLATETTVVDSLGQRLTLNIENVLGGGGQRRVVVSCPYWIVNTTEHSLRYKQAGVKKYVSGTVASASKDGSKPVDHNSHKVKVQTLQSTVFSGRPGALAAFSQNSNIDEFTALLCQDVSLEKIAQMAFMFNYKDSRSFGGAQRLCVQLADGPGGSQDPSDWSNGFSLESVGVSQLVGMHCHDGRNLELAVTTSLAPGKLSEYTKIVRFCPRYVLLNQLSQPIRLWQDSSLVHPTTVRKGNENRRSNSHRGPATWRLTGKNDQPIEYYHDYKFLFGGSSTLDYRPGTGMPPGTAAHHSAFYIATAGAGDILPFHLPDTRADRELRIDFGSNWNLTSSVPADILGEHMLKLSRVVDLRLVNHVNTRVAPKYFVKLPPPLDSNQGLHTWNGELGIWFETLQWRGRRKIIVKGTKRGTYSYDNTDIHVGDELLAIDGESVRGMSFSQAMKVLKVRVSGVMEAYRLRHFELPPPKSTQKMKKPKILQILDRGASAGTTHTLDSRQNKSNDADSANNDVEPTSDETLVLTFNTLEHRMKRIRDKALKKKKKSTKSSKNSTSLSKRGTDDTTAVKPNKPAHNTVRRAKRNISSNEDERPDRNGNKDGQLFRVSNKLLNQTVFVVINANTASVPYRIENRSINHVIYYRQRGCDSHPWNALSPGDTVDYTWEEPMKPFKLTIRVGTKNSLNGQDKQITGKKIFPFNFIANEEQGVFGASRTIKLEEIGFRDYLPCPSQGTDEFHERNLNCHIDTEDTTRLLVISEALSQSGLPDESEEIPLLEEHLSTISHQIQVEKMKLEKLHAIEERIVDRASLTNEKKEASLPPLDEENTPTGPSRRESDSEHSKNLTENNELKDEIVDIADYPEGMAITSTHQLFVEVLEASGLSNSAVADFGESCNPYCSVRFQSRSKKARKRIFGKQVDSQSTQKTYYIEKTSTPKWTGMRFVFNVPSDAVIGSRNYSVVVKVKDFRLVGKSPFLGMTEIHLTSLQDEKGVVGWYPLMSRNGHGGDVLKMSSAGRVCGSIKLRVQWIHSIPSLLQYYRILSQNRVQELETNDNGMRKQLEKLIQSKQEKEEMRDMLSQVQIPVFSKTKGKQRNTPPLRETEGNDNLLQGNWSRRKGKKGRHQQKIPPNKMTVHTNISMYQDSELLDVKVSSRESNVSKLLFRDHSYHNDENRQKLLSRCQSLSLGEIDLDESEIPCSSPSPCTDDKIERRDAVRILCSMDILYHGYMEYFHTNHFGSAKNELCVNTSDRICYAYPSSVFELKSWLEAYEFLNDAYLKGKLVSNTSEDKRRNAPKHLHEVPERQQDNVAYPTLVLPSQSPLSMYKMNIKFLDDLRKSREMFDRAAQRSLMTVLNPGGWLKLRPIAAQNLVQDKKEYTGIFVKVRYGSKSCITQTVPAGVLPTWTDDSTLLSTDSIDNNKEIGAKDPSESRCVNELEVKVEPLKTSGSLRLSVMGVRLNKKTELGVLQIPLANAISCCTEASAKNYSGVKANGSSESYFQTMYLRWFPLKNPKDCNPVEGDMDLNIRASEEENIDAKFEHNYFAPCIKIAMWWKPDNPQEFSTQIREENHDSSSPAINRVPRPLTETYFHANMEGLSISLIDSFHARELLSLSSTDIDVRYSVTRSNTRSVFALGWMQLDHHNKVGFQPVILSPTPKSKSNPTIQLLAIKDNQRSKKNIDSYEHIAVALEEIDFSIEEAWMFDLWEFCVRLMKRRNTIERTLHRNLTDQSTNESIGEKLDISEGFAEDELSRDIPNDIAEYLEMANNEKPSHDSGEKLIYIKDFFLEDVKVNISYIKSVNSTQETNSKKNKSRNSNHRASPQGRAEMLRRWSEFGYEEDWSTGVDQSARNLPNIIRMLFPSITDAPIRVAAKKIDNIFETWSEILLSLKNFYVKEIQLQFYKLIGSLDFVGNPIMVLNTFMKGANDFVLQPFREFIRKPTNPSRLGIGMVKGTVSLFSHFFSGIFLAMSSILDAGGKVTATLSMDEHFKRWHMQHVADHARHKHAQYGPKGMKLVMSSCSKPIEDMVAGVLFGVGGVVVEPYKGLRLGGAKGFSKGVGIGVVGLVAKPLVGVFDAFAHASESIHDVAKSVNMLDKKHTRTTRRRFPYVFGPYNLMLSFNPVDARSVELLRLFPFNSYKGTSGKRDNESWREIHVISEMMQTEPGVEMYVVVTTKRVVVFIVKIDGYSHPSRKWQVELQSEAKLKSSIEFRGHDGCVLQIIRSPERKKGGMNRAVGLESVNEDDHLYEPSQYSPTGKSGAYNNTMSYESENGIHENSLEVHNSGPHPITRTFQQAGALLTVPIDAFQKTSNHRAHGDPFEVHCEFKNNAQLTRIHNAICCLTRQFDSLIKKGVVTDGEGYTSFGQMHFDENLRSSGRNAAENDRFYRCLEGVPWVHGDRPSENERRRDWLFDDELDVSRTEGGPQWAIDCRARATFVPSYPKLPETLDIKDEQVQKIDDQLSKGEITQEQAEKLLQSLVSDLDSRMGNFLPMPLYNKYCKEEESLFTLDSNLATDESRSQKVDEQNGPLIHNNNDEPLNPSNINQSDVNGRLGSVERILQQLLVNQQQQSAQTALPYTNRQQGLQPGGEGFTALYAGTSNPMQSRMRTTPFISDAGSQVSTLSAAYSQQESETESLKREVEQLKYALAKSRAEGVSSASGSEKIMKTRKRKARRKDK